MYVEVKEVEGLGDGHETMAKICPVLKALIALTKMCYLDLCSLSLFFFFF